MKKLLFIFFLWLQAGILFAQTSPDTLKKEELGAKADDPSNFFTRVEFFNELQHYDNDVYLNQTVLRTNIKIGKRFTTRLDLPYVYNSVSSGANYRQSGIGDISFRLLGFKLIENPRSAVTASLEIQLNTARSPILGTGKNLVIPNVSYTMVLPKKKLLLTFVFQQVNSAWGDETRSNISFSKLQTMLIKTWAKNFWTVLAPEWYLDYVNGGLSMNLRTRFTYAPTSRINIWITPSKGIFGDFDGRYQWSADIGSRFFLLRK